MESRHGSPDARGPSVRVRVPAADDGDYSGLERLAAHATDGGMPPYIDRPYPLAEAADAVRHLAAGKAKGKVIITVQLGAPPHCAHDHPGTDLRGYLH